MEELLNVVTFAELCSPSLHWRDWGAPGAAVTELRSAHPWVSKEFLDVAQGGHQGQVYFRGFFSHLSDPGVLCSVRYLMTGKFQLF